MATESNAEVEEQVEKLANEEKLKVKQTRAVEHINEILEIDQDVTRCLQTAGEAVKSLTSSNVEDEDSSTDVGNAKETFEQRTLEYYTLVQSIAARLRRQIYALEEADIIAPDQRSMQQQAAPPPPSAPNSTARTTGARTGTTAATMQQQRVEAPMEITNGGLGKLDIGWLNSRGDQVGRQKEAELWAQARAHLEELQKRDTKYQIESDGMQVDEPAESGG